MKILLFDAPSNHILIDEGREIHGGSEFAVEDERAEDLLTQMHVSVREVPTPDDLMELKRSQLNEIAAEAGVTDPDKLPNKEAVIDALRNPSAAEDGEGLTDQDQPDQGNESEPQEG